MGGRRALSGLHRRARVVLRASTQREVHGEVSRAASAAFLGILLVTRLGLFWLEAACREVNATTPPAGGHVTVTAIPEPGLKIRLRGERKKESMKPKEATKAEPPLSLMDATIASGKHTVTLRRAITRGSLKAKLVKGKYAIRRLDLDRYLASGKKK